MGGKGGKNGTTKTAAKSMLSKELPPCRLLVAWLAIPHAVIAPWRLVRWWLFVALWMHGNASSLSLWPSRSSWPSWTSRSASSTVAHGLDVLAMLEGLRKVADVADDVFVAVDGERDDRLLVSWVKKTIVGRKGKKRVQGG